jgi:Xaa-Pro aminopeptidase
MSFKHRVLRAVSFPLTVAMVIQLLLCVAANAQEAHRRFDEQCLMRQQKFDRILPQVMRENHIDMWIVAEREGNYDPMVDQLGEGYANEIAYYIFTDRGGDRIERATINLVDSGTECKTYDIDARRVDLRKFVAERNPKRIGIDTATEIGTADGLSYSQHEELVRQLGPQLAQHLVSAEKLVSDFRSRHVEAELVAFAKTGEWSRLLVERALSNEVITPGKTSLADVAWWLREQLFKNNLESAFGTPSVYVLGPGAGHPVSDDHIIQPGELLAIDWGVKFEGFYTDMKRHAYVLKPGETAVPPGVQHAFDRARAVRDMIYRTVKPGITAGEALKKLNDTVRAMPGYFVDAKWPSYTPEGRSGLNPDPDVTDIFIGSHSTGDFGHGSGPSMADFNPLRMTYTLSRTNLFSVEFFSFTVIPEWGSRKVTVPLEDDAVLTDRGLEWVYPPNSHILLVH